MLAPGGQITRSNTGFLCWSSARGCLPELGIVHCALLKARFRASHCIRCHGNHSGRCGLGCTRAMRPLGTRQHQHPQFHDHPISIFPNILPFSAAQLPSRVVPRSRPFTFFVFWVKLARALSLRSYFAIEGCKNALRHRGATPASEIQRGWLGWSMLRTSSEWNEKQKSLAARAQRGGSLTLGLAWAPCQRLVFFFFFSSSFSFSFYVLRSGRER
ncbi:hypothetical protein IWX49DRAFT_35053 [Phyllosticta citricarpa]|uniref:Uncharacterized protein n=2 Tax=Phyllosticta TaxID=121621 RepID=A0ABR1MKJ6_9PEZI